MIRIDDLLGARYKRNGRDASKGFDCYGLAIEVSRRLGHALPDIEKARERDYDFEECRKDILKEVKAVEVNEPGECGDVVLMREASGAMSHIGIYLGNGQIIHCDKIGVHVDRVSRLRGLIGRIYRWL